MTESVSLQTVFPPVLVNKYIIDQLKNFGIVTGIEGIEPIIPVQATNIDDLYDEITVTGDAFLIAYDRLIRYGSDTTYWNKREQLVYTIHAADSAKGLDISRVIIEALDREDAAGQDVNTWLSQNKDKFPALNVFFHAFRVFQIDQTADILKLGSVKFNWRGKIIIEYDYHATTSLYN